MRLNVTPIGSGRLSAGQVAKAVVEYLAGVAKQRPDPGVVDPPAPEGPGALDVTTAYYADSIEGPGTWLGTGARAIGLEGVVHHDAFARVLEGRHPMTGERLLHARGAADRDHLAVGQPTRQLDDGSWLYGLDDAAKSLGIPRAEIDALIEEGDAHSPDDDHDLAPWIRASADENGMRWVTEQELDRFTTRSHSVDGPTVLATGDPADELSVPDAARLLGVSARYLRECCRYWEDHRQTIEALDAAGMRPGRAWLVARRTREGQSAPFRVSRAEVAAFAERRQRPVVRVGYDLTLSTEKSVAVLALLSRGDRQRSVLDAIDRANATALRFLEDHAAVGRRQGKRVATEGLVVASFLHATSRALDPFPHRHNVVANAVVDEFGERRALDALHAVEAALAAPAPGRDQRWLADVLTAIDALQAALDSQAAGDSETSSLLSEIATDQPRFVPRIERLRHEHADLRAALRSLRDQIAPASGVDIDAADIRDRLTSVARRLRQHRAREADLIYEAINLNLGGGD